MSDDDRGERPPPGGFSVGEQAYKWILSIGAAVVSLMAWQFYQTVTRTDARLDDLAAIVARDTGKIENIDAALKEHKTELQRIDDRRRDDKLRTDDHFENIENRMFDLMRLHIGPLESTPAPIQRKPPK